MSPTVGVRAGEVMHGMRVRGGRWHRCLCLLRARGVSVPVFNYARGGVARIVRHVPGGWFVYDATPWAPRGSCCPSGRPGLSRRWVRRSRSRPGRRCRALRRWLMGWLRARWRLCWRACRLPGAASRLG